MFITVKIVTEEKKKQQQLISLIRFNSTNKIDNYNRGLKNKRIQKKKKKIPKEFIEQVKT